MNDQLNEFDAVMEQIGFGKVHCYVMLTLGLLQMLTIHETMGMGIIATSAVCDLRMNIVQVSALTAAAFLGIICSSYFWGYITDKMGRRWILLHTISISNICSIISMFMVSFTSFFVMRFLTGIFVAGPSFVAVTYLSEFCNKQILARTVTHMYMFTGFAMFYCPSWATLFLASNFMDFEIGFIGRLTLRPWRLLGCMFMLPGLIAFFLLLRMPESPKFLFMVGETKRGMAVMDWISTKNTGHPLSPEQVELMRKFQESTEVIRQKRSNNFLQQMMSDAMPLFRKPYVGFYVGSCYVMFSLGLVAHGFGIWFTAMRNRSNMRPDKKADMTLCKILFSSAAKIEDSEPDLIVACNDSFIGFKDSVALGLTYIILYNVCWLMLFFLPRKALFIAALVISSSCGFALIFVTGRWVQLFAFVLFIALPGVVISLLGGALLQFVPTHMRAKALCISLMWCRWGAVVGTTIVGIYIEESCEMTILVIAIFPMLSASIKGFLPL
ncbi:synaptic vesicle glycoprotein 2A-like isoform X1 [Drosophila novamexicana]|uniref:synaptic vesicle glycoprotein 2A-like isoform X1 n=2 Tax=Drosophila novamexicana TaxID=47314 RepID=UPI0011E5D13F|nr:synaptic vesicle glycoprotein 2A-like isoform X1 [Drosophila novamexicana]